VEVCFQHHHIRRWAAAFGGKHGAYRLRPKAPEIGLLRDSNLKVTLNYFTNAKSSRWKRRIMFQMHGWAGVGAGEEAEEGGE
jgi:hypothetical protein